MLGRQLKLSWLFCDWNLFSYFSLVDANSFVLVSGYFDIWNLFSLDAAFCVAGICFFTGATYGCSFCRVSERFAPTTSDVVGFGRIIR